MQGPVVCGLDGSGVATHMRSVARELAARYGVPLLYAHVCEEGAMDAEETRLYDAAAADHAAIAIECGHPADRLVALAQDRRASFIVLGNRGPRSSLLGSISAEVSRRAPCPVVVVPPTARISRAQKTGSRAELAGGMVRLTASPAPRSHA
jgi:nucleotide-binding universal stress UspA family protein